MKLKHKRKSAKEKKSVDIENKEMPAAESANEELEQQPENAAAEQAEAAEETVDVAALLTELAKAQAQADEYLNLAQHVQADFNNFRRRNESARADSYAEGQRNVAIAMLPVLDNLERALAAASEDSGLRSGVQLTLKQLLAAFEKLGIEAIDRLGEKFDPNMENAIMQGVPEDGEPGTVCMVLQKGYKMGSSLLRAAMVKVVPD